MKELALIYNILTLFLYGIPFTLAYVIYLKSKKRLYFFTAVLFLFYAFDNTIVYLTEFSEKFSIFYDTTFMTVPTIKTILFIVPFTCMIAVNAICVKMTAKQLLACIQGLLLLLIYMLFIPMLSDGAMKVWLYYTPCQIFTFCLSIYGLLILRKNKESFSANILKYFKAVLIITAVFSVVIVFEDIYVIFNIDVYSDSAIDIYNRSISQDILRIFHSAIAIILLYGALEVKALDSDEIPLANTSATTPETAGAHSLHSSVSANSADTYSKFYLFCKQYQLTTREQEILRLMLDNKTNT